MRRLSLPTRITNQIKLYQKVYDVHEYGSNLEKTRWTTRREAENRANYIYYPQKIDDPQSHPLASGSKFLISRHAKCIYRSWIHIRIYARFFFSFYRLFGLFSFLFFCISSNKSMVKNLPRIVYLIFSESRSIVRFRFPQQIICTISHIHTSAQKEGESSEIYFFYGLWFRDKFQKSDNFNLLTRKIYVAWFISLE